MYILLLPDLQEVKMKGDSSASPGELEGDLKRLEAKIEAAHCSSMDVKKSFDSFTLAVRENAKGNDLEAYLQYQHALYELTSSLNQSKLKVGRLRLHSPRTLSFFFRLYGLYAVSFGVVSSVFFALMIYAYADFRVLDIPLWSSFFAGLGSSAQILSGASDDLRRDGVAIRYKRLWYMTIPLLAMTFGYMAYLLFSSGLVAFNVNSDSSIYSTMLFCFLAGFATSWLINKLSALSGNL
jgi:hypothetical protein